MSSTVINHINVAPTYGAILIGGLIAASLSGVVAVQSVLYIKLFPADHLRTKLIVGAVWLLDLAHSLLVYVSIWTYVITWFGNYDQMDVIATTIPLTVLITGILTFIVHCFFADRIHRLSRHDWRITAILMTLAVLRVCSSTATTAEMLHMKTFTAFKASFRWLFTIGLALSCVIDILIAGFLTYSLQNLQGPRNASSGLDRVINTVILYTLETNLLTSAATVASMVCWLVMPNNLVFMGLHFFISKLYANSLLAALNTRKQLQNQRQRVVSADFALPRFTRQRKYSASQDEPPLTTKLEINIERTVECAIESVEVEQTVDSASETVDRGYIRPTLQSANGRLTPNDGNV